MAGVKGQRSGGHNAKTTEQHIMDGTYQPCRHGERADNVPAEGKPQKPNDLEVFESYVWDEIVGYLPDSCVGRVDTVALREMCRWYALYRKSMSQFEDDPSDKCARLAATNTWDRFWRIASEFGATPVARTRLQLGGGGKKPSDPKSPIEQLGDLLASRN